MMVYEALLDKISFNKISTCTKMIFKLLLLHFIFPLSTNLLLIVLILNPVSDDFYITSLIDIFVDRIGHWFYFMSSLL